MHLLLKFEVVSKSWVRKCYAEHLCELAESLTLRSFLKHLLVFCLFKVWKEYNTGPTCREKCMSC